MHRPTTSSFSLLVSSHLALLLLFLLLGSTAGQEGPAAHAAVDATEEPDASQQSSFARLLAADLPLPKDWLLMEEARRALLAEAGDPQSSSSSYSFDFNPSVAPTSALPNATASGNTTRPSPAPTPLPTASPSVAPTKPGTTPVVSIALDLAGTPEQQTKTIGAIIAQIAQTLKVTATVAVSRNPAPSPSAPAPSPPAPAPSPQAPVSPQTAAPTLAPPPSTASPSALTAPPTPMPSSAPTPPPSPAPSPFPTASPTANSTTNVTFAPSVASQESGSGSRQRRRRLVSSIKPIYSRARRAMQDSSSSSSSPSSSSGGTLCTDDTSEHNTTTITLANFGDEAQVQALLAGILNGSIALDPVDNSTNLQDTICSAQTNVTLVPPPVDPLDEDDGAGGDGRDGGSLTTHYIILIAVLGAGLLLLVVFVIVHRKSLVTTLALGTAAKTNASSAVRDAATLPEPTDKTESVGVPGADTTTASASVIS